MKGFRLLSVTLLFCFFTTISCSNSSDHPLFDHTWKLENQSFVTAPSLNSSLNNKSTRGIQFLSDNQLLMIGRPTFVANFIYQNDSLYYQSGNDQRIHAFKAGLTDENHTLTLENDHETRVYSKLIPPETNIDLNSVQLTGFQFYSKINASFTFEVDRNGTAVVSRIISRSTISDDVPVTLPQKDIQLDSALVEGIFSLGENISLPLKSHPLSTEDLLKVGDQNLTLSYQNAEDQVINFRSIKDPYWLLFHRSLLSLLVEDRLQNEVFDGNPFF
jgi:hypothetical protein